MFYSASKLFFFFLIGVVRLGSLLYDSIKVSVDFLLGFLHVDPVRQAYNDCGDEEADYNSDHQLGLVTVL